MIVNDLQLDALHATATNIFLQGLEACSIESAFDRHIQFDAEKLLRPLEEPASRGAHASVHGPVDLKQFRRIFVIAIGKAAEPMLDVLFRRMHRRHGLRGICCSVSIPDKRNWRIRYFEGGHPLPTEGSFAAARAALALLKKAHQDTLVIYLLSGGGSALFDLPLDPEISLDDTVTFHQALLASGAPITEVNTVRKYFSAVKGGRLALAASEATQISILLPDVPLRSLDVLASGPTFPDTTTEEDLEHVLDRYKLLEKFPPAVSEFFRRGKHPEASRFSVGRLTPMLARLPKSRKTPPSKPSGLDRSGGNEVFRKSMYEVLLSSQDLVEGARAVAQQLGYFAVVDNACDDWDYAEAARYLLNRFHALRAEQPRCCLISGGEVTVTLDRTPGAGGRNMQFALACALELAKYPGEPLVVFSAGSDGIDGNTRSAGAIADTTTFSRAHAFGYEPSGALASFDACPLFTALGDSVVTGPTGHNLRDLRLLMSDSK